MDAAHRERALPARRAHRRRQVDHPRRHHLRAVRRDRGQRGSADRLRSHFAPPEAVPEVVLELSVGAERLRITRVPEHQRPKKRGDGFTSEKASVHLERLGRATWASVSSHVQEADTEIARPRRPRSRRSSPRWCCCPRASSPRSCAPTTTCAAPCSPRSSAPASTTRSPASSRPGAPMPPGSAARRATTSPRPWPPPTRPPVSRATRSRGSPPSPTTSAAGPCAS